MPYANNKSADQPAHPRSLISTFVVRCLDSIICILALSAVSRFQLVSVAEQTGLNLTWSKIPEDTFSRDVAQINAISITNPGMKNHAIKIVSISTPEFVAVIILKFEQGGFRIQHLNNVCKR